MLNSCIYEGIIRHRRNTPHRHQFDFKSFMLMLDLDELDSVFANRWLWSASRTAFARFKESEHLTAFEQAGGLRSRVLNVLSNHGISQTIGSVRLLTQLRYFGFSMNPVSFFYCYDSTGSNVVAIVAEVNNTPWGEQHVYVIPSSDPRVSKRNRNPNVTAERIEKSFHVSPFMSLDMSYRMAFSTPAEKLGVKIENHLHQPVDGVKKILDVAVQMKRKPLTSYNLNVLLLKYPLVSFKIFLGIYWQALRLYLKKTPIFPHPRNQYSTKEPEDLVNTNLNHSDGTNLSMTSEPESVLVSR